MNQYGINIKKTTPRHIMAKLLKTKNKEEILKAAREGKKKLKTNYHIRNNGGQKTMK